MVSNLPTRHGYAPNLETVTKGDAIRFVENRIYVVCRMTRLLRFAAILSSIPVIVRRVFVESDRDLPAAYDLTNQMAMLPLSKC